MVLTNNTHNQSAHTGAVSSKTQTATHTHEDVQNNSDLLFNVSNVNIDSPLSDASYCASIAEQQANEAEAEELKTIQLEREEKAVEDIELLCEYITTQARQSYCDFTDVEKRIKSLSERVTDLKKLMSVAK